ncbi:MAG: hypothetical protein HQ530_05090 [Parcubacteria group bacterium]|nr:hypothetical protein [Parcubacteria group bacterium]
MDEVQNPNNKTIHWVLGAALLLIAIFVIVALVIIYTQAATTEVTVGNDDPVVTSVFASDVANGESDDFGAGVVVVVGNGKTVHVNGVVTDDNGAADISTVDGVFYRSGATSGYDCTADDNDCYDVASCTLSANDATSQKYNCQMDVEYWADATDVGGTYPDEDWEIFVEVTDAGTATDTDNAHAGIEMNTVLGLDIPTAIAYGSHTLGFETGTADNQEMIIDQNANDGADVEVSGTIMTCTGIGTIPIANQEWSLTDVIYSSGTDLTGAPVDTNLAVGLRTDDEVIENETLYWGIGIPATGVLGVCSGTNTITAIAS